MTLQLQFLQQHALPFLSGASGLESYGDELFLLADNSNQVLRLNKSFEVIEYLPILDGEKHLPKAEKADWEATAIAEHYLLLFGSGSTPKREKMVLVDLQNGWDPKVFSIEALYACSKKAHGITNDDFNIEAAIVIEQSLLLFNRGTNQAYQYNLSAFLAYLKEGGAPPVPQVFTFRLPSIEGIESRFSGACTLSNSLIAFTASVEDTANSYDDGAILGSFVGMLDFPLNDRSETNCIALRKDEQLLKTKLESITVQNAAHPIYELLMVSDNDDAASELFHIQLILSE